MVFTVTLPKVSEEGVTLAIVVALAPVPVSDAVCGLPLALSVTVSVAVRVAVAVGVKVTLMLQIRATARLVPQVLVCEKSPLFAPVMVMLVMESVAVPALLNCTVCTALLEPTVWLPKVRLVGESAADGLPAAAPVPVSETVCGLPVALSLIETFAVRVPAAVGVNVTLMVQLALAFTLLPQVLVAAKSPLFVPVIVILVRESAAEPLLVSVTLCAALVVFTVWVAKVRLVGDMETPGVPPPPPPLPDAVTKPLHALSSMHIPARMTPRAPGRLHIRFFMFIPQVERRFK